MPGAVLIEVSAQSAFVLDALDNQELHGKKRRLGLLAKIESASFKRKVLRSDTIEVDTYKTGIVAGFVKYQTQLRVMDTSVAKVIFFSKKVELCED